MIELMVAITISLFLLVGLVSVFATSNQTYMDLGRASQQIENGRFATQLLVDDISHAGFYGRYAQTPVLPGTLPDPCISAAASLSNALALPLQGYSSYPVPALTCLPVANYQPGTGILVVRRVDSTMAAGDAAGIPNASLTAGGIYMQSNADPTALPIIAVGSGTGTTDEGVFLLRNKDFVSYSPIRRYHVHIYFIAPCSVPAGGGSVCTGSADDNGAPIPTLKRLELTANNTWSVVPLVEGIENLQIDYGIDTDKDGVPDAAYIAAPALADWPNVVAVRINVLSRQIEPSGGYVDTKTYDMGATGMYTPPAPPARQYKRHVYNSVIRIINPASRRES